MKVEGRDVVTLGAPHELPLPQTIGGSKITTDRVSGPPSKMYPILRDLALADAKITIEIDTEGRRIVGEIRSIGSEQIAVDRTSIGLKRILAFRVLKIEVDKLPFVSEPRNPGK